MKNIIIVLVVIGVIGILVALAGPFYILEEGYQSVVIRFGEIVDVQKEAGLKFKMPVIDNVVKYPTKILSWDGNPQEVPSREPESQFIVVDTTARWRIVDPELFYRSVQTEISALSRLDDVIESSVKNVITENFLIEALRSTNEIYEVVEEISHEEVTDVIEGEEGDEGTGIDINELVISLESALSDQESIDALRIEKGREMLSEEMLVRATEKMVDNEINKFGIELIDVIIRQIKYSDDLTQSVYSRMIQERNQLAQRKRSIGEGEKIRILSQMDADVKIAISQAYKEAQLIKGEGDAIATDVYAAAYSKDPAFFEFWRTLESYKRTMPQFTTTLSTDAEYFNFLYDMYGR
jgi:modulator of FtsH protease HflC